MTAGNAQRTPHEQRAHDAAAQGPPTGARCRRALGAARRRSCRPRGWQWVAPADRPHAPAEPAGQAGGQAGRPRISCAHWSPHACACAARSYRGTIAKADLKAWLEPFAAKRRVAPASRRYE
jgi:hypothetical protein